jgi:HAD superfamily hydrolase (TIGR01509 family)
MFDVTVFSCAEGTRKPEEGIYDILLKRLDVQSEEVLFIDDNEEYVRGAQQVGINAVLFMDYPQLEQKLRLLLKQL